MNNNSLKTQKIAGKLLSYLRDELKNPDIDYGSNLEPLQGGYETAIFRFQLRGVEEKYSQSLVLRLYPKFYGSQNARWESSIQNSLAVVGYPVAKVHFFCSDLSILGGAFFIMDHLPGQPLMFAHPDTVPGLMGKTHAALHLLDPKPLARALRKQGFDKDEYGLNKGFDWFKRKATSFPWAGEGVDWLLDQRPSEPDRLSVCHGDFHALNILVNEGVVSGVLDWAGFRIADPAFDVANTIVLTTIPAKHLSASWDGFPQVDWNLAVEKYLAAYQDDKEIDFTNLDYYRVRRCLLALIQGFEGQQVWLHPLIVQDLVRYIEKNTGIRMILPDKKE